MEFLGISIIVLSGVILIVSLFYIVVINRTKERMALIEKGLDPTRKSWDIFFPHPLKGALLLMGAGLGFLTALIIDDLLFAELDNPALYAGCVLFFAGAGLLIFHLNNIDYDNEEV